MDTTTCIAVAPGIELEYYAVDGRPEMPASEEPERWSFRVDYCHAGVIEGTFDRGRYARLAAGEFALNSPRFHMLSHYFPHGYYRGLSLLFYRDRMARRDAELLEELGIDFPALRERFRIDTRWYFRRAEGPFQTVFEELMKCEKEAPAWYRLKAFELLYRIGRLEEGSVAEAEYTVGTVNDAVRAVVARVLEERPDGLSLKGEIARSGMSESAFYRAFRSLYGDSPARYLRRRRLERAAVSLVTTDQPIGHIALEAGYSKPGKFSAAFARELGMGPREYRMTKMGHLGENGAKETP